MAGTITHEVPTGSAPVPDGPAPGRWVPAQRPASAASRAPARPRPADAGWRLNVLGPVELCYHDRPVDVTGATRTLLILLARAAGEHVSTASLVAGIWGSDAPDDAENTVASYVSRLRKALTVVAPEVDPTSVVVTLPTGYILDIAAPNVDVATFERYVSDAQRALAVGQPALTAARVDAALGLWRGEAYADARDQSFARAEAARLEELRLAAVELRVQARLALAAPEAPESLVVELDTLIAEHWHRERLWAALMTTLYRLGRRSEALAAHRQAQIRLADGLRVRPGPVLQAVERAVLEHDPVIFGEPLRVTPLPAALAATVPACVGRHEEVAWLLTALDLAATRRAQARLIVGSPGMGKTRLLAEVAQRAAGRGVAVHHGRGDAGCVAALELVPDRLNLVVIDDLDKASLVDLAAVIDFVHSAMGCAVPVPVLVLLTCQDTVRVGEVASLPKLVLTALDEAATAEIVRVYAPATADSTAATAMVNAGGIPARVHRAASEWAFARAGRRIDRAVEASVDPRRWLASVRDEVRGGVLDLAHVRAQARLLRATHRPVGTPYKGLARFEPADAEIFHGRESAVAELVARLVEAPVVTVVGAAGAGKSSLIRAGLLPALASGVLPESAGWRHVVLTPACAGGLAARLADPDPQPQPDAALPSEPPEAALPSEPPEAALPSEPPEAASASTGSEAAGAGSGDAGLGGGSVTGCVLVVDQFEEVFTALDGPRRREFLDALVAAAATHRIVLSVRSDFFPRCVEHPRLARLVEANTMTLGPMSSEELRRAIQRPAEAAGACVDPGALAQIMQDAQARPGDLVAVSVALRSMWDSGALSLAGYQDSGGVEHAVDVFAERAYATLTSEPERLAARRMVLALVGQAPGVLLRRRVDMADLIELAGPRGSATLEALATSGVVSFDGDDVQLTHDALLTGWHRLRAWIDDAGAERHLRRHLARAAAAWAAGDSRAALYDGVRLAAALDWANAHPAELSGSEQGFLMASREVLLAADLRRRRRVSRLWKWLAGMALALLAAIALCAVAVVELARADAQAQGADAARLAAQAQVEPDLRLAALLAVAASRLDPDAAGSIRDVLARSPDLIAAAGSGIAAIAVSPDGAKIAVGSTDGTVALHNAVAISEARQFARADQGWISGLAFTPDGRRLVSWGASAAGQNSGSIVVWDVAAGVAVGPAFGQVAAGASGGLLADGVTLLLSQHGPAGTPTTTVAWNIEARTPSTAYPLPEAAAEGLAVAADGHRVAWGTRSGVDVIDPRTGERRTVAGATRPSALSPDGQTLLTIDGGVVVAWQVSPARRLGEARRHGADVLATFWSSDGQSFASVDAAGLIVVWDARSLQPTRVLAGSLTPVRVAQFSGDGQTLYTAGDDGAIFAWDLTGTRGIGAAHAADADLVGLACALAGRDMTRAEWAAHVPGRDYVHVCPF